MVNDLAGPLIGFAGAVLAVTVAGVGVRSTSKQAAKARESAAEEAAASRAADLAKLAQQQAHESQMARSARLQQRREGTYIEMLTVVWDRVGHAQRVVNLGSNEDYVEDLTRWNALSARVAAFASEGVRAKFADLTHVTNRIQSDARAFVNLPAGPFRDATGDMLVQLLYEAQDVGDQVIGLVRSELMDLVSEHADSARDSASEP